MSAHRSPAASCALSVLCAVLPSQGAATTIEPTNIHSHRLADTDGDGHQELLLVQIADGQRPTALLRIAPDAASGELIERGRILLEDPVHTLIGIADILPTPGQEIVLATPRGIACHDWLQADATEPGTVTVLSRRARFRVRVDQPQFSSFVMDLNQDGQLDLMLPTLQGVRPFLQEGTNEVGVPQFRGLPLVPVPVAIGVDAGSTGLDSELTGSLRIPHIETKDLNGDGRPDLLTREGTVHKFHLQDSSGTFAAPIEIDIARFADSTPKAAMDFGSTAVLGDKQLLQSGDINGDAIPDYVIAHRRKVWTFLADSDGPQFKKARTQAVANDVTALLVVDIDEDDRADLLTFRVQLPSIGTLVLGLVRSTDIEIRAVGYPSEATGFGRKPKWRRTITLRVPPILTLLGQQDELLERFTGLLSKTRVSTRGDFLGAGNLDLAVVQPGSASLRVHSDVGSAPTLTSKEGRRLARKLVFEDEDTVFDIDRVFGLLSGLLDSVTAGLTVDDAAAATIALRDPGQWTLLDLLHGDLDGVAGDELIAVYRSVGMPSLRAYDLLRCR